MTIKRLGAQRFSGLEEDVNNLPIDADLIGAIFNSTDTLGFWIFNGTAWNPAASGSGVPVITSPDGTKGELRMTNDGRMTIVPA